ncbi:hypothetical protein KVT40_002156 [Elsinoe batatas]|uniref:F-box domain-containing protein n=1 Tax=Elsinoe batatas TaxID=2601811 RepID=A0A8K0L7U9_9PEZI|nr:hypothetical protein KVT40_002156 [Elsinoe batatas]
MASTIASTSSSPANESAQRPSAFGDLPVELFEIILGHIYRSDAKSLRLVNKTFEGKISPYFFRSVVVPFNSELQDMVKRDIQARNGESGKGKGKRPAIDDDHVLAEESSLPWMKCLAADDDTYRGHGYKVFSGFGRHIRNFGMSFEVTEEDLRRPPSKVLLDHHESFYGFYEWPPENYRRFDKLASLERTADDISHLRDAMEHLNNVKALGLSLNNGLGWLSCDESIDQMSKRPPIFGNVFPVPRVSDPTTFSLPPVSAIIENRVMSPRTRLAAQALTVVRDRMREITDFLPFNERVVRRNDFGEQAARVNDPPQPPAPRRNNAPPNAGRARDPSNARAFMPDLGIRAQGAVGPDAQGADNAQPGVQNNTNPGENTAVDYGGPQRRLRTRASTRGQLPGPDLNLDHPVDQIDGQADRGGPRRRDRQGGARGRGGGVQRPTGAPIFDEDGDNAGQQLDLVNPQAQDRGRRESHNRAASLPVLHWSQIAAGITQAGAAGRNRGGQPAAVRNVAEDILDLEASNREGDSSSAGAPKERVLNPAQLNQTQKEWLLEADWAMRAFLQSYMLSMVDNKRIFQNVTVFNFAFLSSRFLPTLSRRDFWSSFPALEKVTLHISPDWRFMERAGQEILDKPIAPSEACDSLFWLLHNFVGKIATLKELDVGWVSNVRASGRLSDLTSALPGPVVPLEELYSTDQHLLIDLPHVQHLTFTNCYFTHAILKSFIRHIQGENLSRLNLQNVSLTADCNPRLLQMANRPTRNANGLLPVTGPKIRATSWVALLNDVAPVKVMEELETLDDIEEPRLLDRIDFSRCGYVTSAASANRDFDDNHAAQDANGQGAFPFGRRLLSALLVSMRSERGSANMRTDDPNLAYSVSDLRSKEDERLELDFGMTFGDEDDSSSDGDETDHGVDIDGWGLGGSQLFSGILVRD